MGDRYYLALNCAYCGQVNNPDNDIHPPGIYYAPTCGIDTFTCEKCNKKNFITGNFGVKKIEEITLESIKAGFEMATSLLWTEEEIDKMCRERLKFIKDGKIR